MEEAHIKNAAAVITVLGTKKELLSSRDVRALMSCCHGWKQLLSPTVSCISSPDNELICANVEKEELAFCSHYTGLACARLSHAQLGHLPMASRRALKELTLVSDYKLSQQTFGRGQVLVDLRRLLVLPGLQTLGVADLLMRDGLDTLLHLRHLHTLDLSGALDVNNKLLALLPRMHSLTSLSLPAPSCHAPRLNQCTAQGLKMVLPLMRNLRALHIKTVDLEPLGLEAVRSWQACPLTQPAVVRALAEHTLINLTALTLESLSEASRSFSIPSKHASSASLLTMASAGTDPDVSGKLSSGSISIAQLAADAVDGCGEADPDTEHAAAVKQGPLYQALQELTHLKQLQYLCLGSHVALLFNETPRASYYDGSCMNLASPRRLIYPTQARVSINMDDALVTLLCSELTQLTGLAFKECWSLGTPALDAIAQHLPDLQLLDLEGSCQTLAAVELTRLSTLSQLHTLGLSRWGTEGWCTPYTFGQRLASQDIEPHAVDAMLSHTQQDEACDTPHLRQPSDKIRAGLDLGIDPDAESSDHSWQDIDTEDFLMVRPSPFKVSLMGEEGQGSMQFLMPRITSRHRDEAALQIRSQSPRPTGPGRRSSILSDRDAGATWPVNQSSGNAMRTQGLLLSESHRRNRSFHIAGAGPVARGTRRSVCDYTPPLNSPDRALDQRISGSPRSSTLRFQQDSENLGQRQSASSDLGQRLEAECMISSETAAQQRLMGRKGRLHSSMRLSRESFRALSRAGSRAASRGSSSNGSALTEGQLTCALTALGTQHPGLTALDLSGWFGISSRVLDSLVDTPAGSTLRRLRLASCHDIHTEEVQVLSQFKALNKLDLSYTAPQAAELLALSACPSLDELILSQCNMNYYASKAVQTLADTHLLRVSGCVDANTAIARMQVVMKLADRVDRQQRPQAPATQPLVHLSQV